VSFGLQEYFAEMASRLTEWFAQIAEKKAAAERARQSHLDVAQKGPLLSNLAYSRSVEAAVEAAKSGVKKNFAFATPWREAIVRLLQSRANPPLSLFWSFVVIERSILTNGDAKVASDIEVMTASCVLQSLKCMTTGFCDGPVAIAAIAPIVRSAFETLVIYSSSESKNGADAATHEKKLLFENLSQLIRDLSGFIALCHHKECPAPGGLFKAPSVCLGLDKWIAEGTEFSSLFPFASTSLESSIKKDISSADTICTLGVLVEAEVGLLRLLAEVVHERPLGRSELEKKLKHELIVYAKFLGSSGVILDALLAPPLPVLSILSADEESTLRGILGEVVVTKVANPDMFNYDNGPSPPSKLGAQNECVVFLKRLSIARKTAAYFRSMNENLRASDLLSNLRRQSAPSQLGDWLGGRSVLRILITTAVLEKPEAVLDWLLNAEENEFNRVFMVMMSPTQPQKQDNKITTSGDAKMVSEGEDANNEPLFFFDTTGVSEGAASEPGVLDADQEFAKAAGTLRGKGGSGVLFHGVRQVEEKPRKRKLKAKGRDAKSGKKGVVTTQTEDQTETMNDLSDEMEDILSEYENLASDISDEDAIMD
jgi:hypothetical protein